MDAFGVTSWSNPRGQRPATSSRAAAAIDTGPSIADAHPDADPVTSVVSTPPPVCEPFAVALDASGHIADTDVMCALGIRSDTHAQADRMQWEAFCAWANYGNVLTTSSPQPAAAQWWARYRNIPIEAATRTLSVLRVETLQLFFHAHPEARQSAWRTLSQSTRHDANVLFGLMEVMQHAPSSAAPGSTPQDLPESARLRRMAQRLAQAQHPMDAYPGADIPYLFTLALSLRQASAQLRPFLAGRVSMTAQAAGYFVRTYVYRTGESTVSVGAGATRDASPMQAYRQQREADTAALLYATQANRDVAFGVRVVGGLARLRQAYADALQYANDEFAIMSEMFVSSGDPSAIWHDGFSLHNARGMRATELVAYLEQQGIGRFSALDDAHKVQLVRRRLFSLQEHPDYPIGSVHHAMATALLRMQDANTEPAYVRYPVDADLLLAWEARRVQWYARRDFMISPELLTAMHQAASGNVLRSGLGWYRQTWEDDIIAPLKTMLSALSASPQDRVALWRWLANVAVGWSAERGHWDRVSPDQYVAGVYAVLNVIYELRTSAHQVVENQGLLAGIWSDRYTFSPLLNGLSDPLKWALYDFARSRDTSALERERVLAETWMGASYRLLTQLVEGITLAFQAPPSFSVEAEAYKALLAAGVAPEQMDARIAHVHNTMAPPEHSPLPVAIYDGFLSVIRSPRADDALVLPSGKLIYPHRIVNQAFDAFRSGLTQDLWVVAKAKDNLRSRGVPLLKGTLDREIEAVAAPIRAAAHKHTELGTALGDYYFGSLPITAPLLKLARAARDGKFADMPYYALVLASDILAMVAICNALGAAYVGPVVAAGRFSMGALLTTNAMRRTLGSRRQAELQSGTLRLALPKRATEVQISGQQMASLQSRVLRPARAHAAHDYFQPLDVVREVASVNDPIHHSPWHREPVASPADETDGTRAFHRLLISEVAVQTSLRRIAAFSQGEGEKFGVLGFSDLTAQTIVGEQTLAARPTVLQVIASGIAAPNSAATNVERLLNDHFEIRRALTLSETEVTSDTVADGHPIGAVLRNAYQKSSQFRALLNAYDARALERGAIRFVVAENFTGLAIERSPQFPYVHITLPSGPDRLPVTLRESGLHRQTFIEAVLEGAVSALCAAEPMAATAPMNQRGLVVWLTNSIQWQLGEPFDARLNAWSTPSFADMPPRGEGSAAHLGAMAPHIAYLNELEDQYLERYTLSVPYVNTVHRFMGTQVKDRPTVLQTRAVLDQLNFNAFSRADAAHVRYETDNETLFWHPPDDFPGGKRQPNALPLAFSRWFDLSDEGVTPTYLEDIQTFIGDLYLGSTLFRCLLAQSSAPTTRWKIFPFGPTGANRFEPGRLVRDPGVIDASSGGAMYLGLIDTYVRTADAKVMPSPSVVAVEPIRMLLDGVVSVLLAPLSMPYQDRLDDSAHRGAVAWLSDTMMWQAHLPIMKRLVAALVSRDDRVAVDRMMQRAAHQRRLARVEDDYLVRWLENMLEGD